MKNLLWPALLVTALVFVLAGCAQNSRARSAERLNFSTPTGESLPGGMFPVPAITLPPLETQPAGAQPAASVPVTPTLTALSTEPPTLAPPTLAPLPTLVPTIALPTATEQPTLAPTAALPPLDAACLAGAWQVTDLQQAMAGSLAQSGSTLALEGVEGRALYVFGADGSMSLTYQQLAAVLNGTVENRQVRVVQSLDGTATARYAVDPAAGVIEMSAFGGEGIRSALAINGQTLAEGSLPVWLAFTRGQNQAGAQPAVVQASRAAATCDGSTLTLQAREPVPGPALRLERVVQ